MTSRRAGLPEPEAVDLAVEVFRMLADGTRVRLLWLLLDGESSVSDLADGAAKPPAAVSQHLAKLRMARLVATRRQGNQVFYRLANDHVRQLVIDAVHHAEHAGPGSPHTTRGPSPRSSSDGPAPDGVARHDLGRPRLPPPKLG